MACCEKENEDSTVDGVGCGLFSVCNGTVEEEAEPVTIPLVESIAGGSSRMVESLHLSSDDERTDQGDHSFKEENSLEEEKTLSAQSTQDTSSETSHLKEVDYDRNPTRLFLLLYHKDWDAVIDRVMEFPEEASIWITRKGKEGETKWRIIPIHCAIIYHAPDKVIRALLYAYPNGAKAKDDQGMLPKHVARQVGSPDSVVNLLGCAAADSTTKDTVDEEIGHDQHTNGSLDKKPDSGTADPRVAMKMTHEPESISTTGFIQDKEANQEADRASSYSVSNSEEDNTGTTEAPPPVTEVDLDAKPTQLFHYLHQKEWKAAIVRAMDHPKEVEIWISRKQSDGSLRWRLLPLHCAVMYHAPKKVIRALLFAYPYGAKAKDDKGMLPHQLAERVGGGDGTVHLLTEYFETVEEKVPDGKLQPCHLGGISSIISCPARLESRDNASPPVEESASVTSPVEESVSVTGKKHGVDPESDTTDTSSCETNDKESNNQGGGHPDPPLESTAPVTAPTKLSTTNGSKIGRKEDPSEKAPKKELWSDP